MLTNADFKLVQQVYHDTEMSDLAQWPPNYGPWAKCGPRSHFVNDEKIIC